MMEKFKPIVFGPWRIRRKDEAPSVFYRIFLFKYRAVDWALDEEIKLLVFDSSSLETEICKFWYFWHFQVVRIWTYRKNKLLKSTPVIFCWHTSFQDESIRQDWKKIRSRSGNVEIISFFWNLPRIRIPTEKKTINFHCHSPPQVETFWLRR